MRNRRRLGIVQTKFGIPSEVWALRQAEGLNAFEPVYLAESRQPDGLDLPDGRQLHLFGEHEPGFLRRALRKVGNPHGIQPTRAARRAIREACERARVEALLCHFSWNAVLMHAAVGQRLPIVAHFHGRDISRYLQWPASRRAVAAVLPELSHVIVVGRHQRDTVLQLHPDADVSVIPCGAPTKLFSKARIPERMPGDPFVVISVGRLSAEKGLFETLQSIEALNAEGIPAKWVVIGDGPLEAGLRDHARNSCCSDRVRFTGRLRQEQVAAELRRAHVLVQHSTLSGGWVEGFGVSLTEAGATGLPIVATRTGGIPDQVTEGRNGFLCAPGDVAAQTHALKTLEADEALRHQMGAEARRVAASFDSESMTERLDAKLQDVLG